MNLEGNVAEYTRLTETLKDFGKLVPSEEIYDHINDPKKSWFRSIYFYSEKHMQHFKEVGSIAGIVDVYTRYLIWDFDFKEEKGTTLEQARQDTIEITTRLLNLGIKQDQFNICFSGNKGFSVELEIDTNLTPGQFKSITSKLASGLVTRDPLIVNPARVMRLPYTAHNETGLYKIPITLDMLCNAPIDTIKGIAKDMKNMADWNTGIVSFPKSLIPDAEQIETMNVKLKPMPTAKTIEELDLSLKPKHMPACRYAILNGFFEPGERSNALTALVAHFRGQGFPKEVAYHACKGAIELQSARTGQQPFSTDELWLNIISQVYGPHWKGGTYACKDHEFLQKICEKLGTHACSKKNSKSLVEIKDVFNSFKSYAKDIEKNTIKTGIDAIDKKIRLQTGSHVILAGCSGAGKTTLILNILNKLSEAGSIGMFMSMDMNSNLICQKLAQRVTELDDDTIYNIYKNNDVDSIKNIEAAIDAQYKNIKFDFRSGMSIDDIREGIESIKAVHGNNVRLVVIDFINRISGPYSDETANLSYIAPKLSDLANDTGLLIISLAQIARSKGGPSTPLTDSRVAKGSSAIEESATVLFGIWRPGYNKGSDDKYMCMAALKTRMGKEFNETLYFNGLTSEIRGLTKDEQTQYEYFLDQQEEAKKQEKDENGGW